MAMRAADQGEPSGALRPIIAPEGAVAAHDTHGGGGTVCSVLTPRVSSAPLPPTTSLACADYMCPRSITACRAPATTGRGGLHLRKPWCEQRRGGKGHWRGTPQGASP